MHGFISSPRFLGFFGAVVLLFAACTGSMDRENRTAAGGIKTLYCQDPLAATMSFQSGRYGGIFQENQARNFQSDMDFGRYRTDTFTVGIEGSRAGRIVDLGSREELATRYGFCHETLGRPQGYASLRMKKDQVVVMDSETGRTTQPLKEAEDLFVEDRRGNQAMAQVHSGHVYVVRVWGDRRSERIVKILVLEHRPGESVTFRWERIR
jgi:hypothetical protein